MKHAGVAVSITTFTDVIAFFIGSNTVLPGLQSFCIYAAVAIFCIYALQITHFVAWFSLGNINISFKLLNNFKHIFRRPESEVSQGWLPLLLHSQELQVLRVQQGVVAQQGLQGDREPPAQEDCPDTDPLRHNRLPGWRHLGHDAAPAGISGVMSIKYDEQNLYLAFFFQPQWLLPPESEISKWFYIKERYFPSAGEPGYIMLKQIDMGQEFSQIQNLVHRLSGQ